MKRLLVITTFVLAVPILIASAVVAWRAQHKPAVVYTDGQTIHQHSSTASLRQILWLPPTALNDRINTIQAEYEPCISPDGQTLYFVRGKAGTNADIFVAHRSIDHSGTWNDPEPRTTINSADDELGPAISSDGLILYFYSNRPGGLGGYDLWRSQRTDSGWQTPHNLGQTVNTEFNEYSPALSPDGSRLYFASNRPQPGDPPSRAKTSWPATLRENTYRRDYDLFLSLVINDEPQPAAALNTLNTTWDEGSPAFSPAGDFLYFSSNRVGGHGGFDLYRSRLLRGDHLAAENIGVEVNTAANELDPALSMGGFALHFSSDRPTSLAANTAEPDYNLYQTMSREVFGEDEAREPLVDWASLARAILPSLLWLLLGLLALLALAALIRGMQSRRMSLMARCLMASLIAHLILMILLTFWQVTTSLTNALHEGGSKITIASNAASDELAAQIRSGSTETTFEFAATPTSRAATDIPTSSETALTQLDAQPTAAPAPNPIEFAANPSESEPVETRPLPLLAHEVAVMQIVEAPAPSAEAPTTAAEPTPDNFQAPQLSSSRKSETAPTPIEPQPALAISIPVETTGNFELPATRFDTATIAESTPPTSQQTKLDAAIPNSAALSKSATEIAIPSAQPVQVAEASTTPKHETVYTSKRVIAPTASNAQTSATSPLGQTVQLNPESTSTAIGAAATDSAAISFEPHMSGDGSANLQTSPTPTEFARASEFTLPAFVPDSGSSTKAPPVEPFAQRREENRKDILEKMGGSEATERAVALALKWLAAHQNEDGRWAAKTFDDNCGQCSGAGKFNNDMATTALAIMCFLASDHTHRKDGGYRTLVDRGLTWLLSHQKPDGDLRGAESMYSHGIATIALAEAYGMTHDEKLLEPVRKAVAFIVAARNESTGGWRYEPGQAGDTSVLGWQVMALVSAKRAGITAPQETFESARSWMELVSGNQSGQYAYQPGQRPTPSMTAEGMFVQQLLGSTPEQPHMRASAQYLLRNPPRWTKGASTYYWYYATLAMFQNQGSEWQEWNAAVSRQLLDNQQTNGNAAGSWDPIDNWSKIGGRVYQTALCTLSLEVYYRYLPMYGRAQAH